MDILAEPRESECLGREELSDLVGAQTQLT